MDYEKLEHELKEFSNDIIANAIANLYVKLKSKEEISQEEAMTLTKNYITMIIMTSANKKRSDNQ